MAEKARLSFKTSSGKKLTSREDGKRRNFKGEDYPAGSDSEEERFEKLTTKRRPEERLRGSGEADFRGAKGPQRQGERVERPAVKGVHDDEWDARSGREIRRGADLSKEQASHLYGKPRVPVHQSSKHHDSSPDRLYAGRPERKDRRDTDVTDRSHSRKRSQPDYYSGEDEDYNRERSTRLRKERDNEIRSRREQEADGGKGFDQFEGEPTGGSRSFRKSGARPREDRLDNQEDEGRQRRVPAAHNVRDDDGSGRNGTRVLLTEDMSDNADRPDSIDIRQKTRAKDSSDKSRDLVEAQGGEFARGAQPEVAQVVESKVSKGKPKSEDAESEDKKLADEMERRRKRVQEWQERRRKQEAENGGENVRENAERVSDAEAGKERQSENVGDNAETTRNWSLEEESDDEDDSKALKAGAHADDGTGKEELDVKEEEGEEEEIDPLDAFMNSLDLPPGQGLSSSAAVSASKAANIPAAEAVKGEDGVKIEGGVKMEVAVKTEEMEVQVEAGAAVASAEHTPAVVNVKVETEEKDKVELNGKPRKLKKVLHSKRRKEPQIFGMDSDHSGEEMEADVSDEEASEVPKQAEEDDAAFVKRVAFLTKADKLPPVDHSSIEYPLFRKAFYREVREIERMKPEEVQTFRKENEFKISGKDVPKPIRTWNQTGLSSRILEQIKKMGFEKPMPIQCQTLPVIMSGRDCIGIAKTGSGKTLAFVLPMLRHIMDQPPIVSGDGPIGLIMAPTRELVQQIYNDIRKFSKPLGMHCVPVYGGSGVAQQIGELKRGAEIVVCTPGRMIDILCTSNGKISNLRRVTYVVLDEADRMFDMGFEPQITKIIQNVRPDRQTVLFSATFPRSVETLARQVLAQPVTIQVGGRSVVNKDITQIVEIRPDGQQRFLRLLELLGEWGEKGKVLVFVQSQDKCDMLFRDLLKSGYPCLSLHGAKDQTDRESTISDFKSGVANLLIATSVAARGLDVKELELVVNYDVPNHYEDYVHRVGRTGRAGKKGHAVTFLAHEEDKYAPDLVRALELSEQPIPQDLKALADSFQAKVKAGSAATRGSGYGGSGYKFDEEEEEARKEQKKAQAKEYGVVEEEEQEEEEDENEGIRRVEAAPLAGTAQSFVAAVAAAHAAAAAKPSAPFAPPLAAAAAANPVQAAVLSRMQEMGLSHLAAGSPLVAGASPAPVATPPAAPSAVSQAAAFAAAISLQATLAKLNPQGAEAAVPKEHYELDFEINDFPQHARWKITHKETLNQINEWTGADVTIRGVHVPPGKKAAPGERKLYLFVSGPTEGSVRKAKAEIKRILEEASAAALAHSQSHAQPGRYSVL